MLAEKIILWDFDGTLAYRPGGWSGALVEALIELEPNSSITAENLRPFLYGGFPWHEPEKQHTHITTAELWWAGIEPILMRSYTVVGLPIAQAEKLARLAHQKYLDTREWLLYEDVIPTLERLLADGWEHIILSNHVPELSSIVDKLGLTPFMTRVISSALTGYEKPHPKAFLNAIAQLNNPRSVWMIGDNIIADIIGAEAIGIPGILVRKQDERAKYCYAALFSIP